MSTVKYKDCVIAAAVDLQLDDVVKALESPGAPADEQTQKDIDLLTKCLNSVLHEIACDYSPLKKTERLKSNDFRIYFRDFSQNAIDIFAVYHNGRRVDFKQFYDCILVQEDGTYNIEYSYAPFKGTLETSLEWDDERVGARVVAYGVACEYCIISGLTDEAALWDKRFKDALFKGNIPKKELVIKRRIWA